MSARVLVLVALVALVACGEPAVTPLDAAPPVDAPLPPVDAPAPAAQLVLDRSSLTFGTALLGVSSTMPLVVRNTGMFPTGSLAFAIDGDTASFTATSDCPTQLASNATCTVVVAFAPQGGGLRSASLSVSASPGGTAVAMLHGVGQLPATLEIIVSLEDVGDAVVGLVGASAATLVVTNVGDVRTGSLRVQPIGADPGDFALEDQCTGRDLAPGETCTIELRLQPRERGGKSAGVEVTGASGGFASAAVRGRAIMPAQLRAVFKHRHFGSVASDRSATDTIVVENIGDVATGPVTVTLLGGTGFTGGGGTCANQPLAPGATCTVDLQLASAIAGAKTGKLTVAAAPGGVQRVTLEGTVTSAAQLALSSSSVVYPAVPAATLGAIRTFTITNRGSVPTGALLARSNSPQFAITTDTCTGQSLVPTGACDVAVRFGPDTAAPHAGRLDVSSPDAGSVTAAVTGLGLGPANLVWSRPAQRFGSVPVGGVSAASVELRNVGDAPSAMPTVTITGADAAEFSMTHTCTASLAPSAACTVTVRFAPTSLGPKVAALGSVPLTGTAITAGGLAMSPARFTFAPRVLATGPTAVQLFTLRNTSAAPITNVALTATAGFELLPVGLGCTSTLAANATCAVNVRFGPAVTGDVAGALTVTSDAGALDVALDARGTPRFEVVAIDFAASGATTFGFGAQTVGATIPADVFVTVRNNTVSNFISVTESFGLPAQFRSAGSDCTGAISEAPATCTFRYQFAPTAPGLHSGMATFLLGQTADANNTIRFHLTGTGL